MPVDFQSSDDPFIMLADIPATIDAAAVFNNPAERFLLNDSGRKIRELFSFGAMFSNTEHAWDALSKAFNADTDETIKALLSKRVVVLWDEINSSSDSLFKFTNAIDTRWTLVCEVEPQYLQDIRAHLKPVRRRIEHGQAVYAIEKGRYEIALLSKDASNRDSAIIILAPKKGSPLLNHVIASYTSNPSLNTTKNTHPSIVHNRDNLIASVDSTAWSVAWILQLNRVKPPQPNLHSTSTQSPAIVGIITTPEHGISAHFATDIKTNLPQGDAPEGLLSAVGSDAIMAIATARTPSIFAYDDLIHALSIFKSPQHPAEPDSIGYPQGPGLILLSEVSTSRIQSAHPTAKTHPIALTLLTQFENTDQSESSAKHVDKIMHNLFESFAQSSSPDYQGRFPNAVRTHTIEQSPIRTDAETPKKYPNTKNHKSWLGNFAKFSWLSSDLASNPVMITTLAPDTCDTTNQIRWIAQAAKNLDAIPNQTNNTGVITSGYFKPAQALSFFDTVPTADSGISKLIETIEWNIKRAPSGFAGSISIEFAEISNQAKIGNDHAK